MGMITGLAKQYPSQFEIQLMFYYGTDAYAKQWQFNGKWGKMNKIHNSEWSSDTKVFQDFLSTVVHNGGTGYESI